MEIDLPDQISVTDLLEGDGLPGYKICDDSIGDDDRIHILLAENVPEREQGMFVPTKSNTHYRALSLVVGWQGGGLLHHSSTDFALWRPTPTSSSVWRRVSGNRQPETRARRYKDGSTDQNALITDHCGNIIGRYGSYTDWAFQNEWYQAYAINSCKKPFRAICCPMLSVKTGGYHSCSMWGAVK